MIDLRSPIPLQRIEWLACAAMVIFLLVPHVGLAQSDWQQAMKKINPAIADAFEIDEQQTAAAGIRKISGQHIELYTDVPASPEIDELVEVFDLAIEPWCDYFGIDLESAAPWKMRVFLIADADNRFRFQQSGLFPDNLPSFPTGFQRDHNIWIYLQPGNYYTRHLLIHEGTHGFMQWFLDGYGGPWYSEGIAELFGVHRWSDKKLTVRYRLRDRTEALYWGRIKGIIDDQEAGKAMTLTDVLNIPPNSFREVRYYGWSWAGCKFLSEHARTKLTFADLKQNASLAAQPFNQVFSAAIQEDWKMLERDWELFIGEIEYGYQIERGRLSIAKPGARSDFEIQSDKSWQVTPFLVKQGDRIRISSTGKFQVGMSKSSPDLAQPDIPWPCQSNGITIQYYQGQPLGMLHAGILDIKAKTAVAQVHGLLESIPIGAESEFTAETDGILCLRINESPSQLDDNQGALEVNVEKLE